MDKIDIISLDLENLKSKALMAGLFLRFETIKALIKMKGVKKGIVMVGMKSLIECLEDIDEN